MSATIEVRKLPTAAQAAWLRRGLTEPGGKLPLFDMNGRKVDGRIIRSCIELGWAEPWFSNPIKPEWLVCKLTAAGRGAVAGIGTAAASPLPVEAAVDTAMSVMGSE